MFLGFEIDMPDDSLILPAHRTADRDVPTDHGDGAIRVMRESDLQRTWGGHENENEIAVWVEYRLDGKLVHRSARVHLKKAAFSTAIAAAIG